MTLSDPDFKEITIFEINKCKDVSVLRNLRQLLSNEVPVSDFQDSIFKCRIRLIDVMLFEIENQIVHEPG